MSQVDDIARIVGLPRSRRFTVDWQLIESDIGTALPRDYKELAGYFGPGEFLPYVTLLVPGVASPALELRRSLQRWQRLDAEDLGENTFTPVPHFPHPGGLIPWGNSSHGEVFYWRTVGEPDDWPVLVCAATGRDFYEYQGGVVDFIHDLLTGRLRIPFIPSLEEINAERELDPDLDEDEVEVRPEFEPDDGSWPYDGALPVIAGFEADDSRD